MRKSIFKIIKGVLIFSVIFTLTGPVADAAIVKRPVAYQSEGLQLEGYLAAMGSVDRDWQMILYGGAKHGFSDPGAARYGMKEFEYNETADRLSWKQVGLFLSELFAK